MYAGSYPAQPVQSNITGYYGIYKEPTDNAPLDKYTRFERDIALYLKNIGEMLSNSPISSSDSSSPAFKIKELPLNSKSEGISIHARDINLGSTVNSGFASGFNTQNVTHVNNQDNRSKSAENKEEKKGKNERKHDLAIGIFGGIVLIASTAIFGWQLAKYNNICNLEQRSEDCKVKYECDFSNKAEHQDLKDLHTITLLSKEVFASKKRSISIDIAITTVFIAGAILATGGAIAGSTPIITTGFVVMGVATLAFALKFSFSFMPSNEDSDRLTILTSTHKRIAVEKEPVYYSNPVFAGASAPSYYHYSNSPSDYSHNASNSNVTSYAYNPETLSPSTPPSDYNVSSDGIPIPRYPDLSEYSSNTHSKYINQSSRKNPNQGQEAPDLSAYTIPPNTNPHYVQSAKSSARSSNNCSIQ